MKKLLALFILVAVLFASCTEDRIIDYALITIENDNPDSNLVEILNSDDEVLFSAAEQVQDTLFIDEGYYSVDYGSIHQELFLKPGYDLTIAITNDDSIKYSGVGATENEFLIQKQVTRENFGDLYYGMDYYKRDENSFLVLVDSLKDVMDQLLVENRSQMDSSFYFFESKSFEYERLYKIASYEGLHSFTTENRDYSVPESFPDPFIGIALNDNRLLQVENYISFLKIYFRNKTNQDFNENDDYTLTYITLIKEEVKSPQLIEMLAYETGIWYLNRTDELDAVYEIIKELISNPKKLAEVEANYLKLKKVEKGSQSPGFSMKDINGHHVSLADFKGKLVYIDVWATWCKPCVAEIPDLKKTEEYFAGKEIVFVSISIDHQKESWKKMIVEKERGGVQLFADDPDDPFIEAYDVQGIPRFILLDRTGKIIDPNITRPSDEDLIPLIEANL